VAVPAIPQNVSSVEAFLPVFKKHYAMGTVFEIVAYEANPSRASAVIDEAFQEIDRLDQVMSRYKPASELSHLNRSAHFRAQVVSPDLYQVMEESLRYSELSVGAFDVTAGPLAERWKAVGRGEKAPSPAEEKRLRRGVGYRQVEMIPPCRIRFHSSRLEVDLGAIGKGYALDRAAAVLRSGGLDCALINSGGSTLYGLGSPPDQSGWLVYLRDPSSHLDPHVLLREYSVSTSEQTPQSLLGMSSFGHIIDTATGKPLKTSIAVSVVAETATASDALSTAFLLMGPAKGRNLVKRLKNVAALWVSPERPPEIATSGPEILMSRSQVVVRNPD
jgi:thiamine biosynthesis lipoprotein